MTIRNVFTTCHNIAIDDIFIIAKHDGDEFTVIAEADYFSLDNETKELEVYSFTIHDDKTVTVTV